MKYFLCVLLFVCIAPLSALTLGDEFRRAEVGDYVVFLEQKHLTLFRIATRDDNSVGIEEITTQEKNIDVNSVSWQAWLNDGAPNHTSWTLSTLDLSSGHITASYSYSTNEWQGEATIVSFLPTLLKLPLEEVPAALRKKIGPAPDAGDRDMRKLWVPKVVFNRTTIAQVPFNVYRAEWPDDESELRGKVVLLYIPTGSECLNYFPYWIEVVGLVGRVKLRVIDSGKKLSSPQEVPLMNNKIAGKNERKLFFLAPSSHNVSCLLASK